MKLDFDLRDRAGRVTQHLLASFKWVLFGILVGLVVGFCASVFAKTILLATSFRLAHTWIIFLMPAAGIIIVYLYHLAGSAGVGGTNLILASIRKGEEVPAALAPLIFVATSLTHLTGGSAGREGAALQMGGSMSSAIAKILHFPEEDRRQVIMCGMSAAFSALFGTPLAAAVLPMEISTVGIMYHSAFVPCVISSLTAHFVAGWLGLGSEQMLLTNVPSFDVIDMGQVGVFADTVFTRRNSFLCDHAQDRTYSWPKRSPMTMLRSLVPAQLLLYLRFSSETRLTTVPAAISLRPAS